MNKGIILKIISDKGFGFISQENTDKDLFFHSSQLQNIEFTDIKEGDEVTFEINEGPKGLNATNISKV